MAAVVRRYVKRLNVSDISAGIYRVPRRAGRFGMRAPCVLKPLGFEIRAACTGVVSMGEIALLERREF